MVALWLSGPIVCFQDNLERHGIVAVWKWVSHREASAGCDRYGTAEKLNARLVIGGDCAGIGCDVVISTV